jgi:methylmalonyl-CoA mutase cobalamin-binding subunit
VNGTHPATRAPTPGAELKRRKANRYRGVQRRDHPADDIAALKKRGAEKLFTPGTPLHDIVDWLR